MPSEGAAAARERPLLALLRSQGLGVACGLATVGLLAVGSFVLAATRQGASAGIALDDVTGFFERPSPVHAWFYLLVPALGLYAVNTVLATWSSLVRKVRAGVRAPASYAPAVIHLGFLVALAAHGVGGLLGGERGETVLAEGGGWQRLPDGRAARLVAMEVERLPGGMPRQVRAQVEVRGEDGVVAGRTVGYNQPLSDGAGSELQLLADVGEARVARLSVAGEPCPLSDGGRCLAAGVSVRALALAAPGEAGPAGLARVEAGGASILLVTGQDAPLPDGRPLRLEGVASAPALLLRSRSAPGNPLALVAALLVVVGLAMMGRRFLPARGLGGESDEAMADAA